MLTYKHACGRGGSLYHVIVLLDGKVIGYIMRHEEFEKASADNGWSDKETVTWQYKPKDCGKKFAGEHFKTLAECQRSLEEE